MDGTEIDWLAVVIAAFLNMVIGYFWYSKWFFGKTWMKLSEHTKGDLRKGNGMIFWAAINSLVIAYFLAFFESHLAVTTVSDGLFVGFTVWLGFVATTQIAGSIYEKKPLELFFLHTGCKLLSFLVMGGIIGA